MSKTGIFHFRLLSGEELFARYLEVKTGKIIVDTPMLITEVMINGQTQVMLHKYMPWSIDQTCILFDDHVISMVEVHTEVAKFYQNTIAFQEMHAEPGTFSNIKQANKYLSHALSKETSEFTIAACNLGVDLNQINYERPN